MSEQFTGSSLIEQVNHSRRKKKIEALKGKISSMLDDREAAEKVLRDIDDNIIQALQDAGLSADDVAEVLA